MDELTNPDKILLTKPNVTKGEIAAYYETVQSLILPYLKDCPLALVRCPNGLDSCFFQKNIDTPSRSSRHIHTQSILDPEGKPVTFLYIDSAHGLMELCQLATLEIHRWGTRRQHPLHPNDIVFDIDPAPDVPWRQTVDGALELKAVLENLNLISFINLTGGKGLHIHVPIAPQYTWQEIKDFSHTTALYLEERSPGRYISTMTKSQRGGKIFVDYLRNGFGATAIAPYSTRARQGGRIALPISWNELPNLNPDEFTIPWAIHSILRRRDPWKDYFAVQQRIEILDRNGVKNP